MDKLSITNLDLSDLEQPIITKLDIIDDFIIQQSRKGKKLTARILSDRFRISDRTILSHLYRLENRGKLKSTLQSVSNGRTSRLTRVFEAKKILISSKRIR